MRLATWNIHNAGGKKVPQLAAAIEALEPDVIVLTEYTANASDLRPALDDLGLTHWCHTEPVGQLLGVAIASNRGLVRRTHEVDPCHPWAGLLSIDCDGLHIVGAYGPGKNSHIPGTTAKIKGRWWDGLLGRCEDWRHEPCVIIGDLNNGINRLDAPGDDFVHSDKFSRLPAHGFHDAWRALHGNAPGWSFHSARYGWRRLDHLFQTQHVTVDRAEYRLDAGGITLMSDPVSPSPAAASDHAALVAEVFVRSG